MGRGGCGLLVNVISKAGNLVLQSLLASAVPELNRVKTNKQTS